MSASRTAHSPQTVGRDGLQDAVSSGRPGRLLQPLRKVLSPFFLTGLSDMQAEVLLLERVKDLLLGP